MEKALKKCDEELKAFKDMYYRNNDRNYEQIQMILTTVQNMMDDARKKMERMEAQSKANYDRLKKYNDVHLRQKDTEVKEMETKLRETHEKFSEEKLDLIKSQTREIDALRGNMNEKILSKDKELAEVYSQNTHLSKKSIETLSKHAIEAQRAYCDREIEHDKEMQKQEETVTQLFSLIGTLVENDIEKGREKIKWQSEQLRQPLLQQSMICQEESQKPDFRNFQHNMTRSYSETGSTQRRNFQQSNFGRFPEALENSDNSLQHKLGCNDENSTRESQELTDDEVIGRNLKLANRLQQLMVCQQESQKSDFHNFQHNMTRSYSETGSTQRRNFQQTNFGPFPGALENSDNSLQHKLGRDKKNSSANEYQKERTNNFGGAIPKNWHKQARGGKGNQKWQNKTSHLQNQDQGFGNNIPVSSSYSVSYPDSDSSSSVMNIGVWSPEPADNSRGCTWGGENYQFENRRYQRGKGYRNHQKFTHQNQQHDEESGTDVSAKGSGSQKSRGRGRPYRGRGNPRFNQGTSSRVGSSSD